jgi:hypothetical protein
MKRKIPLLLLPLLNSCALSIGGNATATVHVDRTTVDAKADIEVDEQVDVAAPDKKKPPLGGLKSKGG